jgi:hypothetical protein
MKSTLLSAALLGAAFGVSLFGANGSGNPLPAYPAGQSSTQVRSSDQNQVRAFTGTIAKTGDRYVLREDSTQVLFDLDDPKSVGKFSGRKVKVTGIPDAVNHMIHAQPIEEAPA